MPELAEVARIVHFLRRELVGRTITKVTAQHDDNVFGKVGTSAAEIQQKLLGKQITGAGQQGKYFWMTMSSPPHPVMHFGMTGWFNIRGADTFYHPESSTDEDQAWPPKFWKFALETDGESKKEAAFTDKRRLGRVRLVDCPAAEIRDNTPLKENGPDPVIDKDIVSVEWLQSKLSKKKVPIKALLLDQAQISGLGNWMTDEVLYQAQIHPEQYSNTVEEEQVKALHSAIHHVCSTSVDLLGEADEFPTDWVFHHRWNKGKKKASHHLPNGDRIVFLTVGGRTSAVVPAVQKKTGPVAKDFSDGELENGEDEVDEKPATKTAGRKRETAKADVPETKSVDRKRKAVEKEPEKPATGSKATTTKKAKATPEPKKEPAVPVRRGRSAAKK